MKIIFVNRINVVFFGLTLLMLINFTLTQHCCKEVTGSTATSLASCRCGECPCEWTRFTLKALSDAIEGVEVLMRPSNTTHYHNCTMLRYETSNNRIFIQNADIVSINGCTINSTKSGFRISGTIPLLTATGNYDVSVARMNKKGSYKHLLYGNEFIISFVCATETNSGNVTSLRIEKTEFSTTTSKMKMTMKNRFLDSFSSASALAGLKYTIEQMMGDSLKRLLQTEFSNAV